MTRKEEIKEQAQGRMFLSCAPEQNLIGMAEWADKTMIEKACEWLRLTQPQIIMPDTTIERFKKAMEE